MRFAIVRSCRQLFRLWAISVELSAAADSSMSSSRPRPTMPSNTPKFVIDDPQNEIPSTTTRRG